MESHAISIDHRKRRRRRKVVRSAISAWLTLNENVKSDVGLISEDLYRDLFGQRTPFDQLNPDSPNVRYIAISPWIPFTLESQPEGTWTIMPVIRQSDGDEDASKLPPSTVRFSPSSLALQSFGESLQTSATVRGSIKGESGVEIRILDVEPLNLDTVYVTIDGDALQNHDEVQKRFGGGFDPSQRNGLASKGKGKGIAVLIGATNRDLMASAPQVQHPGLTAAIRQALASSIIVRQGNLLPLPLPTHPITHVSLPPAKITFCEPVDQGLLTPDTNVILSRIFHKGSIKQFSGSITSRETLRGMILEEDDDTSNEQFYSAVEDRNAIYRDGKQELNFDSSDEDSSSVSDEFLENIISMAAPGLPVESSGIKSSITAPALGAFAPKLTGSSTPGSVYSNFTVATARQGAEKGGREFQAQCLRCKVSDDVLHPRPASDEDEEARVFVEVKMLLKIGCFSGDWIRVESTTKSSGGPRGRWDIEAFEAGLGSGFRAVKVYGLQNLQQNSRFSNGKRLRRRLSTSVGSAHEQRSPTAWFSPILLANLDHPAYVRLSPLLNLLPSGKEPGFKNDTSKVVNSSMPPIAKEMTVARISTPVSTERALQTGLLAALTRYFGLKRRLLRKGDLIPLAIDLGASRMLAQPATPDVDHETEDLLSSPLNEPLRNMNSRAVAWFRVEQIVNSMASEAPDPGVDDIWGGVASVEPMITRTVQVGNEHCKAPPTVHNSWEYYLGVKPLPKPQSFPKASIASMIATPKPYITPLRRRLRELIAAATSPQAIHLGIEPMVILLHSTQRNIGKATLATRASADLGVHVFSIDAYDLLTEGGAGGGDIKTEALLKARFERAMSCGASCTTVLIRHVEAFTADRMVSVLKDVIKDIRILVATTTELEKVSEGIRGMFTHEIECSAPNESEREGILRGITEERSVILAPDVDLTSVALKTAALVAGDLADIVERAMVARQNRLELLAKLTSNKLSVQVLVRDVLVSGGENVLCVTKADFELAVDAARKNFADSIGAPKIPNVSWEDVGGLQNVKDAVMETIQLPLERPELFAKGMKKRSGILFYGPPGTGKTLLAKAIATEFSLNFFSVKGPELLNMYIGESEANVRRVFQRARDARPCVVFFDELDSVAPKRGNQGDSGGVMDRIVSQLLAELDGMSDGDGGGGGVFVIGATNRPDLLDQALLRPGRFDKMLYLGIPDSHEKQLTILEALTRKFNMHPTLSLRRVAGSLPFTYTGADLYALCSDAMLKAITRQASAVDTKIKSLPGGPVTTAWFFDHLATEGDIAVMVTEEDFGHAQGELIGSVSAKELEHYRHVRQVFEGVSNPLKARPTHNAPSPPTRLPIPVTSTPLALPTRPKYKSRSSTARPKIPVHGKGKGKATHWDGSSSDDDVGSQDGDGDDDDDDDDDNDDEAYTTSNDFGPAPEKEVNGGHRSKEVRVDGFGDAAEGDDENIYGL
ncbi:peroxisomal assembly protein [Pseudocyphellaria aurata]|nr:peroxisomal assembly protein [Pseudocyphellaria aurata]